MNLSDPTKKTYSLKDVRVFLLCGLVIGVGVAQAMTLIYAYVVGALMIEGVYYLVRLGIARNDAKREIRRRPPSRPPNDRWLNPPQDQWTTDE